MIIHNHVTNPIGNYRSVCARFGKQRNVRIYVTKMKVCGKKYLVHDHRRLRSRFRLMAPGLMVNVSRAQVPCVIGAITDSHSDVLTIDFIS